MKPTGFSKTVEMPNGKPVTIETGILAKQADGSIVLRCGDTMLLATVVANKEAKEDVDFLPLTVDYREKFSAAGRFPGGFFKREAKPSDAEVLVSRLIDRALRPMFPSDFHAETQVMVSLLSYDPTVSPDSLAGFAASAAISVSDIPFHGPISEVKVGRVNGEFIINPSDEQLENSDIDMIIAGSKDSITMVEGEMLEISEAEMLEAIKAAHKVIIDQCIAQEELAKEVPNAFPKREYNHEKSNPELFEAIRNFCYDKVKEVAASGIAIKEERKRRFTEIREAFLETLSDEEKAENAFLLKQYFGKVEKEGVRDVVLEERKRLDGRKLDEIRPIWCEVDYLPGTHGSAVFTRGETQSLTSLTLGSKLDEQSIDTVIKTGSDRFLLHYNFPAFSTGEARPNRGPGRREIGHGNLAMRALKNMVPGGNDNPYTIRLVSDILESNGSSSMATVCAGTLALMDGGVKMKNPVSGIAMGLITNKDGSKYAVLSDILGDEDHLGDMDFKVCGTTKGITACQMDIKIEGLNYQILEDALEQSKAGRLHILNELLKTIDQPREDYKEHAPRIVSFEIPKENIGAVIGPGGKIIQEIQNESGATVVIEEVNNKGLVQVVSNNKESMDKAVNKIKSIAIPRVIEVGETFKGKVKAIMPYGAFVELVPGTDGLLHISEIAWEKIENVKDVFNENDQVEVKVLGKDPKSGKLKLSRKVLLPKPEKKEA
ncbi:polyribonucleotide nucleotidyltransferase [Luteibaculum oceani]|uniref:Polyribonucleotide nucleotidyltransferase n=1 Tax=Luteibaculum oceani TaxID=1294296 RepID=A0A5C6V1J5_9FLAO|nr:polyribonucleotide nucleotidyltransferase [Luteibaculum oceani]TXC78541.1 polyribonucleotide nucleotidyltransferase [Luteibaculum oceani]